MRPYSSEYTVPRRFRLWPAQYDGYPRRLIGEGVQFGDGSIAFRWLGRLEVTVTHLFSIEHLLDYLDLRGRAVVEWLDWAHS